MGASLTSSTARPWATAVAAAGTSAMVNDPGWSGGKGVTPLLSMPSTASDSITGWRVGLVLATITTRTTGDVS